MGEMSVGDAVGIVVVTTGDSLTATSAEADAVLASLPPAARRSFEAAVCGGASEIAVEGRQFAVARVPMGASVLAVLHESTAAVRRLEVAEQRFESFMGHCPTPAVIKDGDGRYVWANDAYFATYRMPREGWVGSRLGDHVGADQAAAAEALDRRVLDSGRPLRDTHHFLRPDGTPGMDAGVRFPLPDADGRVLLGGIFLDLSEDRTTRDRLATWRNRYRTLFDRAPIGMVVTTARGVVLDANPAFCELVGMDLFSLRGRDVQALSDPAERDHELRHVAPVSRGRATTSRFEKTYVRPDGSRVAADVTVVRVPDPDDEGPIVGIVAPLGAPRPGVELALSPNEVRVLELRAAGVGAARTASELGITRRGVDYHLRRLGERLDCHSTDLVARAYHLDVLDPASWPARVHDRHRADPEAAPGSATGPDPH